MRTATLADTDACKAFLQQSEYAVVATATVSGAPEAAVVTYLIDTEWNIYFFTRKNTAKEKNLTANPQIALVVGTGPGSVTAQINGVAEVLDSEATDYWMGEFLTKREGFYMTFLKLEGYDFVGYKVTPKTIHWLSIAESADREDVVVIKA